MGYTIPYYAALAYRPTKQSSMSRLDYEPRREETIALKRHCSMTNKIPDSFNAI